MYFVYVLQSEKDQKLYIGCTNSLKRRIKQHESGKVEATKTRRPMKLIYLEGCLNETDAYMREKYFKMGYGRRFIKNRLKKYYKL